MERWTAAFLKDSAGFLTLFSQIEISGAYLQQLPNLISIIPQLIQLQKFADAKAIIEMLRDHRDPANTQGFPGRAEAVSQAMENLDNEEVVKLLVEAARTAPPDVREILSQLFVALGRSAVPALVLVLVLLLLPVLHHKQEFHFSFPLMYIMYRSIIHHHSQVKRLYPNPSNLLIVPKLLYPVLQ